MQAVEGKQWWIANLGSSEIRFCAAHSTNERANHWTTPAGFHFLLKETTVALHNDGRSSNSFKLQCDLS